MTDTATDERAERASALDRFAATETPRGEFVPQQQIELPAERVIGAQAVAVRRDEQQILVKLKALAAAAGSEWFYRFPVKDKGSTSFIEGPSIKLANDLARLYGNCDVDVRVTDLGDVWLIYARFTDYETGFSLTRPFQQRKSGSKLGGADNARRLDIALQIGTSKAIRNTIVNALQTYADFAFEEARGALVDKIGADLPKWRKKVIDRLAELDVDPHRVERVIGRSSADWLAPDMARIIAMMKAIADGMATLDETFPPLEAAAQGKPADQPTLDDFAAAQEEGGG